jgi:hypothetical protein
MHSQATKATNYFQKLNKTSFKETQSIFPSFHTLEPSNFSIQTSNDIIPTD